MNEDDIIWDVVAVEDVGDDARQSPATARKVSRETSANRKQTSLLLARNDHEARILVVLDVVFNVAFSDGRPSSG